MVYHNVVWLDVAVHDALRVAVVKRLENFEHVVPNVVVCEALVQFAEIRVACVHEFRNDRGSFGQWISYDINKLYYIDSLLESLQDFDFSADLVLLDYY